MTTQPIPPADVYAIHAALGAPLPAPEGANIVTTVVSFEDHDTQTTVVLQKWVHGTDDEARIALARWCLASWETAGNAPWTNNPLWMAASKPERDNYARTWVEAANPDRIISHYFWETNHLYTIEQTTVDGEPEWANGDEIFCTHHR